MGPLGGVWLGMEMPRHDKALLAQFETDRRVTRGIAVASGCRVGRRILRVVYFGKVAVKR